MPVFMLLVVWGVLAGGTLMPCHVPGEHGCGDDDGVVEMSNARRHTCGTPTPVRTSVPASLVGDGVCDCCDCSDEAGGRKSVVGGGASGATAPRRCVREIDAWAVAKREAAAAAAAGAAAAARDALPRPEIRALLTRARDDARRAARAAADAAAAFKKAERELRVAQGTSERKAAAAWGRARDLAARARSASARADHTSAVRAQIAFFCVCL